MKKSMLALVLCAAFGLISERAQAGVCTKEVNQFEAAIQQSPVAPDAGPTAPETIGAMLGHQPTPASVESAETRAQSQLADRLAHARALDARGRHAACIQTLSNAEMTFDP